MRIILFLLLLLITSASFGQVLQETNGSRADNRNVFKLGFRLPQVCWVTGNPNLLNYSAFQSKGAIVYDTCANKIKRWDGSVWISVADSMATGDTTGLGALFIRNTTTHENKRFSVQSGRLDSILAPSSAGLSLYSNSGTQVGLFGAGGGAGATFYGGVNIDGTTRLNTGLTGVLVGTSGTVSATPNKMVSTFAKNATRDSAILTLADGTRLAVRDSVGGGGGTPGGGTYSIQYNLAGANAGRSTFVFDTVNARVGIGTASPAQQLHTTSTGGANSGIRIESSTAASYSLLQLNNNTTEFAQLFLGGTTFTSPFASTTGLFAYGVGGLAFGGSSGLIKFLNAANAELARFRSGGLSLGTTAGTSLLHLGLNNNASVNTGIRVNNTNAGVTAYSPIELLNNNSNLSQIFLTSSGWTPANGVRASGGGWNNDGAGGLSFVAQNAAGDITFHTNTSFAERLRIDQNGGVSVGSSADAVASSILDLTSTTKGVLFPRMTTVQKAAIATPVSGLVVYDTTLNKLCVYTGAAWETITSL
jgi:hypothetical protein